MTRKAARIKTPDVKKETLNQGADNERAASSTIVGATRRDSDLYDDNVNNSKADYSTNTAGISPTNNGLHVNNAPLVQSDKRKQKRNADRHHLA
jgi:hypothetical protein